MRSKGLIYIGVALLALLMIAGACSTGFILGRFLPADVSQAASMPILVTPTISQAEEETGTPEDLATLFEPFWQSWDIIQNQYIDQPVDSEALMQGAIKGMFEALGDQYSSYMDPFQFQQASIPMDQEYDGIGAWVDTSSEYLTIFGPMPGSPAEEAGLRPGDKVIAINGEDMTGIDGSLVVRRILGPAGTPVKLTIVREGEPEPFEVEIVRAKITIPSVTAEMLDNGVGYVQILQFADNTRDELRDKMSPILAQNPVGMIVDLRYNGGGYLSTAVEVTSEFLGEGVILIEEYGDGTQKKFTALSGGLATEIPLVVLVNEGSASASEIMAGALRDNQRAVLVGTTTFGKGTVQNWIPLSNGTQGAVRITIARWLTPDGEKIHEIGLLPDYLVELSEEDIQAERDVQLEKAIEVLTTD